MKFGSFILGCEGTGITGSEARFFRDARPLGFILFQRNIASREQLRRLVDSLREAADHQALVLIDQEGGRVQRMEPPHWTAWLPPLDQCQLLPRAESVRAMWLRYRMIAAELRDVGIDTNCVPVADIAGEGTHEVLRNRCYGFDPESVSAHALAVADACLAGGVLPVAKHIPGQGRMSEDSHLRLPRTNASEDSLRQWEWQPFKSLRHLPLGMTSHALYSSIDGRQPATWSSSVLDIVRNQIGFEGLLMTDDISMSALSGNVGHRSRRALDAGCDIVLHCNGNLAEMQEVAANAGILEGAAEDRARAALDARKNPSEVDVEALGHEFRRLVGAAN
ncbi:MAG: beta-hexosaminidase [Rhodobacteraceae bacterium]|nr:beta-hexosaminidase [Paracoccaceae bacterium]